MYQSAQFNQSIFPQIRKHCISKEVYNNQNALYEKNVFQEYTFGLFFNFQGENKHKHVNNKMTHTAWWNQERQCNIKFTI